MRSKRQNCRHWYTFCNFPNCPINFFEICHHNFYSKDNHIEMSYINVLSFFSGKSQYIIRQIRHSLSSLSKKCLFFKNYSDDFKKFLNNDIRL